MLKRWMCMAMAACLSAVPAWADEPAAQVTVGITRIELPVPEGFVEPTRALPQTRTLGERLTPPANRLLAFFLHRDDVQRMQTGQPPLMQRYFMAQTLRQAEDMLIAQDQFDQVRATLRDQYRSLLSQVGPQVQGQLDATARDMGREAGVESLSLKIGELKGLEVFDDRPGSISLLAATRYVVELEGSKKEIPMAMSITTAIFKGRLVYFYAYAVYQSAADLDWLRTVTRDWLPLAVAAN